jgi:hypothetical protein
MLRRGGKGRGAGVGSGEWWERTRAGGGRRKRRQPERMVRWRLGGFWVWAFSRCVRGGCAASLSARPLVHRITGAARPVSHSHADADADARGQPVQRVRTAVAGEHGCTGARDCPSDFRPMQGWLGRFVPTFLKL